MKYMCTHVYTVVCICIVNIARTAQDRRRRSRRSAVGSRRCSPLSHAATGSSQYSSQQPEQSSRLPAASSTGAPHNNQPTSHGRSRQSTPTTTPSPLCSVHFVDRIRFIYTRGVALFLLHALPGKTTKRRRRRAPCAQSDRTRCAPGRTRSELRA